MIGNVDRIHELRRKRSLGQRPKFSPGDEVKEPFGEKGVIDAVFADYEAAVDARVVPPNWYELQARQPASKKEDYWYSVILPKAGVLAGEKDLILISGGPS